MWLVVVLAVASIAAGCGSDDDSSAGGADELQKVSYRTGFPLNVYDAGWFVAKDKGFYEDAGLDVEIDGGQGSATNLQVVASGRTDFATSEAGAAAVGVSEDLPVKMVASFTPNMGTGIITDPEIETIEDMEGKTYGGPATSYRTQLLPVFENASGAEDITVQHVDATALPDIFINGRVDMMPALAWVDVPLLEIEDVDHNFFPWAEYGVEMLGLGIMAHEETLRDDPELVRAFVEASLEGWQYAYDHPEEAVEILKENIPDIREDWALAVIEATAERTHTPATENDRYGWMSEEDWTRTVDLLVESELLPAGFDPNDVYENVLPQNE